MSTTVSQASGPKDVQTRVHAWCLVAFTISVWLISLGSPVILTVLYLSRLYWLATTFLFIIMFCYAPLPEVPALRDMLYRGVTMYFRETSVTYEAPLPGGKTLLAVHPHGIFCFGWCHHTAALLHPAP